MSDYQTIKELVIETCMSEGAFPSYEKLTTLVLKNFPTSKWQKTHYAWYKSKIKRGEIPVPGFGDLGESATNSNDGNENEILETVDVSLSLERDLHSYLATRVSEIESGLVLAQKGIEYQTEAGRIDILANDKNGNPVVIELKAGKAKDNALGQLLGYMGCMRSHTQTQGENLRGILVASDFEQRVVYAARGLPTVKLVKYKVSFELQEIT